MVRVGGMSYAVAPRARIGAPHLATCACAASRWRPTSATRWPAGRRSPKGRAGEPIWEVVGRYLRALKTRCYARRVNQPKLLGVKDNQGISPHEARRLIVALLVAAVAGGGWYWYQLRVDSGEVRYRVAKVERGPMAAVVAASGTLNAVTTVQVGSQISGQVKEIYADFNTAVKKGQLIARIDPADLRAAREPGARRPRRRAARGGGGALGAGGAAGRSSARQDRSSPTRSATCSARRRWSTRTSSRRPSSTRRNVVLDSTREQLKAVQAQLEVSRGAGRKRAGHGQAARVAARAGAGRPRAHDIRAPVDGTVILRNVDAGQTVAASLQAPVLFTIAQDLRECRSRLRSTRPTSAACASGQRRHLRRRRLPAAATSTGDGRPDPQGRRQRAERRHLHGGGRGANRAPRCCPA